MILIFHILVCAGLILVVLLQSGKGGGLAGAFGGGGGQTGQALFGGRGAATVLTKASSVLGIVFLVTSLTLAVMASRASGPTSVIRDAQAPGTIVPALDAPSPAQVGLGTTDKNEAASQENSASPTGTETNSTPTGNDEEAGEDGAGTP